MSHQNQTVLRDDPQLSSSQSGTTKPVPHLPGEVGIWVFILGDLMVFSLLFGTYLFYRAGEVDIFTQSQPDLNRNFGALNTVLLLTSSWFVATAVQLARHRRGGPITPLLGGAILCGLGFSTVKVIEYHAKFAAGITISTNDFFMFYFVLTGIHFLHLILGTAFLTYLWNRSRKATWTPQDIAILEVGATFWHLVDLLWIVLFPLLYLIH